MEGIGVAGFTAGEGVEEIVFEAAETEFVEYVEADVAAGFAVAYTVVVAFGGFPMADAAAAVVVIPVVVVPAVVVVAFVPDEAEIVVVFGFWAIEVEEEPLNLVFSSHILAISFALLMVLVDFFQKRGN